MTGMRTTRYVPAWVGWFGFWLGWSAGIVTGLLIWWMS